MNRRLRLAIVLILAVLALSFAAWAEDNTRIRLATTTSTEDTGLLGYLLPEFTKATGYTVDVIAVGTGKAIRHGENGEVDVLLVHAPAAEKQFVDQGFGVARIAVMQNDFVLLGPTADPAGIKGQTVNEAFKLISAKAAPFISRGDDSGTHKKELELWAGAGIKPDGAWYMQAGQGMGACLTMADEKQAYIMSDRGTYLARKSGLSLVVLVEGDAPLLNPYAIIAVNPQKYPYVNAKGAQALIDWITSPEGQRLIGDFKVGNEQLFKPTALPR